MLPGFIPRLRKELVKHLETLENNLNSLSSDTTPFRNRYEYRLKPLIPLKSSIYVLNDPTSSSSQTISKTPAFSPSLMGWIGGSLVGALKTSAIEEISKEKWENSFKFRRRTEPERSSEGERELNLLPDWSRPKWETL